ncbi:DUF2149 domain-containing protein [Pseudomonas aeruginosa]|nr:DUF2149 domain-containing protein [Pseudomonas aeruginosa]
MRSSEHDEADDPDLLDGQPDRPVLVVIGILLIVIVQNPLNPFSQDKVVVVENPGEGGHAHAGQGRQGAEALPGQRRDRRRAGQPRRVTYRLADGRMIYVPESGGEAGK